VDLGVRARDRYAEDITAALGVDAHGPHHRIVEDDAALSGFPNLQNQCCTTGASASFDVSMVRGAVDRNQKRNTGACVRRGMHQVARAFPTSLADASPRLHVTSLDFNFAKT
jgi:hypothetical protein